MRANKLFIVIGILVSLPFVFLVVLYVMSLVDPRFTWNEMDLNGDGIVSFSEADYVGSSGVRRIVVDGKECLEYFAYKDGLPVKTVCEN